VQVCEGVDGDEPPRAAREARTVLGREDGRGEVPSTRGWATGAWAPGGGLGLGRAPRLGGSERARGAPRSSGQLGRLGGGVRQGAAWADGDQPDAGGEPVGAHDCSAEAYRLCAGRGVWRPSDSPASSRGRLSWPARCADGQLSVRSWPAYPAARWSWVSNRSVSSCSTWAWSHPWRAARLTISCRSGWKRRMK
jgi:hypothetical protein